MDILNFISWIKGGRIVTSVDPSQTLIPVGLKDNRRDDGYLAGAISVLDLAAQIAPTPAYKVYTALVTQNGLNDPLSINTGTLTLGVTYLINDSVVDMDFTNVGAPNNNLGTYFVATGTTPVWGTNPLGLGLLIFDTGAPVVTVLENTIGNIWFTYDLVGFYGINSNKLFTNNKTIGFVNNSLFPDEGFTYINNTGGNINLVTISTLDYVFSPTNAGLLNTPIEIRVYN